MSPQKALSARRIAGEYLKLASRAPPIKSTRMPPLCGAPVVTSLNALEDREYISRVFHPFERLFTKSPMYKACLVFVIPSCKMYIIHRTIGTHKFPQYLREIILICKISIRITYRRSNTLFRLYLLVIPFKISLYTFYSANILAICWKRYDCRYVTNILAIASPIYLQYITNLYIQYIENILPMLLIFTRDFLRT